MPAKIILTSLLRAGHHSHAHPGAHLRTMTMKPQPPIKNLAFLVPTEAMVKGHKRHAHPEDKRWQGWTPLNNAQYEEQYRAIWDKNIGEILAWYGILPDDAVIVLCCYCRPGDFCHRRLVAKWLPEVAHMLGVQHEVVLD